MSSFIEFNCPSCGRANLADPSEVGPDGAIRACQGCGAQCFVSAGTETDTDTEVAGVPAATLSEEEVGHFHLRMPSGRVEHLSTEVIEHGIHAKRVLPWDLASADGSEFHPVSEIGAFGSAFVDGDFFVAVQRQCVNHGDAGPAGTCRRCGRSFCAACVQDLIRLEPRVCPACSGSIQDPDPRLSERPLWERPKEVARIPIDGNAWKLPLVVGVLFWVASWSWLTSLLYLLAAAVVFQVVRQASKGAKTLALTIETDAKKLLAETGPAILLTALMALPLVAIQLVFPPVVAVFIQLPLSLLILAYFPMAIGLLALGSPKGMEPRAVVRAIVALRENYLLAVLLLIAVGVVVIAAQTVVSFVPLIGGLLARLALGYGAVLQAYILGWLVYMNRERVLSAA